MVGAGESPLAEVALEGPVPCVLAVVAGQLIGAGKFPATAFPGAVVGLLACGGEGVSVGLEVPTLPMPSPLCSPAQHPHLSRGHLCPLPLEEGSPTVYSSPAHLCLTHLSFCPPSSCPSPCAQLSHVPCVEPVLWAPQSHFKLWVLPCLFLLWGHAMCPISALTEGLTIHPQSVSPTPLAPSTVGGLLHVPPDPASSGIPGP